jgi:hypothetical protein
MQIAVPIPRRLMRQVPFVGSRDFSALRQLRRQPDGTRASGHPAAPVRSNQRARWWALIAA